jgi:hypothetical protein
VYFRDCGSELRSIFSLCRRVVRGRLARIAKLHWSNSTGRQAWRIARLAVRENLVDHQSQDPKALGLGNPSILGCAKEVIE